MYYTTKSNKVMHYWIIVVRNSDVNPLIHQQQQIYSENNLETVVFLLRK